VGMSTSDGHQYDVDFIAKGESKRDLSITNIMIHAAEGRDRYEWYQQGRTWKTRPAGKRSSH